MLTCPRSQNSASGVEWLFTIQIRKMRRITQREKCIRTDVKVSKQSIWATMPAKPVDWVLGKKWQETRPETPYKALQRLC